MVRSRSAAHRAFHVCLVLASVLVAALASAAASAAPNVLSERQARVSALEKQVGALEERYDGLQEKRRGVSIQLAALNGDAVQAQKSLKRARARLAVAQEQLRERVIAMYQTQSPSMALEFASGGSISSVFERIEASQRIGARDVEILQSVRELKKRVQVRESKLQDALSEKQRLSRALAREDHKMRSVLDVRRSTLASAGASVRKLMEEQRRAAALRSEIASKSRAASMGTKPESIPDATPPGSSDEQRATEERPLASSGTNAPQQSDDPAPTSIPLPPASGSAAAAASIAVGKVGAPYVWAAAGPGSFDCSGLVVWAFAQAGRPGLPHSTYALIEMGIEVPLSQAQPGDLIFTNSTGHMGIYVGNGNMVHSPRTGRTVSVEPLTYYNVESVRRI